MIHSPVYPEFCDGMGEPRKRRIARLLVVVPSPVELEKTVDRNNSSSPGDPFLRSGALISSYSDLFDSLDFYHFVLLAQKKRCD